MEPGCRREECRGREGQVHSFSPRSIVSSASSVSSASWKLIFVQGMPKSGTTSLQEAFLPQVEALAEMNGMFWKDTRHQTGFQAYPTNRAFGTAVGSLPEAMFRLEWAEPG